MWTAPPNPKTEFNQAKHELSFDPDQALAASVSYYNHRRYHKAQGNVTPADVIEERREQSLPRRRKVKAQTINGRRIHNRTLKEFAKAIPGP